MVEMVQEISQEKALAEAQAKTGIKIKDLPPESLELIIERSKSAGNAAFREKRYSEAITFYSQAIAGDPNNGILFANRSAAELATGIYDQALSDAQKAVELEPDWAKSQYRLGCAAAALNLWDIAATAFQKCHELAPGDRAAEKKYEESKEKAKEALVARQAYQATERRRLVLRLRAARQADQRLAMLNQFKQSMAAPDWELEDLEWRPSWLPGARLAPLDLKEVLSNPKQGPLLSFLRSLTDLAQPKAALRILEDHTRFASYQRALDSLVDSIDSEKKDNLHILTLGAGGGILPLIAARTGVKLVTAVERGRMLYRMAKQVIESNKSCIPSSTTLKLLPCGLHTCRARDITEANLQQGPNAETSAGADIVSHANPNQRSADPGPNDKEAQIDGSKGMEAHTDEHFEYLPTRADILCTDLLDHTGVGMGILSSLDYAAQHLLKRNAIVLPSSLKVFAMLVEVKLPEHISGFDLSPLDSYRWWPGDERVDLHRLPHRRLSKPFLACNIDLQERVRLVQWRHRNRTALDEDDSERSHIAQESPSVSYADHDDGGDIPEVKEDWEEVHQVSIPVISNGHWNAVAFWFELDVLPRGLVPSSTDNEGCSVRHGSLVSFQFDVLSSRDTIEHSPEYCLKASNRPRLRQETSPTALQTSSDNLFCCSWGQALQYVDIRSVSEEDVVELTIRRDKGQIIFDTKPSSCRLRNNLAPRWHFDMVQDDLRNDAYEAAIRSAIARRRAMGSEDVTVLDIGTGTGLLSMMAARSGAKEVFAVEISSHMTDVAEETVIANGFFRNTTVYNKDVRRLDTQPHPDGTPADLPRRANMAIFEIFDSGLIGEGALHLLSSAQAKLLTTTATLVPASATVYAQPIQFRFTTLQGFDVTQANQWRWRPEYEGIELNRRRDAWKPLAPPQAVFSFDFYDASRYMRPDETVLHFDVNEEGVCNAIAMWFELDLDDEITLSTSPYEEKGPTWQQAVQWLPEIIVRPKDCLAITARHDTYSISFEVEKDKNEGLESFENRLTGVPLVDPMWKQVHDALEKGNAQLVKACVQNPLEFRAAAQAAVAFAARPHDLGLDPTQAAEFCMKLMG